ncbi:hypothetical protein BH11MYX3_BH11MYX3_17060 [soil metagenome]
MRFILFVLGLALGIAGTLAYVLFASSAEPPPPVAQALPANPPLTVTLSEPFLTALVRRGTVDPPGVSVPRTALRAELRDDTIIVHANVEVLGQPTESSTVLRPLVRNGRLAIDVVETHVGSLPMPAMDQLLDQQINARISSLLDGMPVTITGVKVERDRGLTVSCQVDLDRLENVPTAQATR